MSKPTIPNTFATPQGRELAYLQEVLAGGHYRGDGPFTKRCHQWLEENTHTPKALLTHSCTAALEMSALLTDLAPGDEVIMPSFTFVSTANAVALRGAVPVFVDIRGDTMNIDENKIVAAITPRTKGIIAVHYAGVASEMDALMEIGRHHSLVVMEDAAQGLMATYKRRHLGTIGHLGSLSFHETKNIVAGEGGALFVNDARFSDRAEIIREKGTNRLQFFRGQVDKYTWVDVGSSYLPSEFNAAVLLAQLERASEITQRRLALWHRYQEAFADLESRERVRRPIVPAHCQANGHIYYLLARDLEERTALIAHMKERGIGALFHYVPLHNSPAGQKLGRVSGRLEITETHADRLVRLPLWTDLSEADLHRVIESVSDFYRSRK